MVKFCNFWSVLLKSTLFGVVAHSGYRFDSMQVAQQGDYELTGAGALVNAIGTLAVSENGGSTFVDVEAIWHKAFI